MYFRAGLANVCPMLQFERVTSECRRSPSPNSIGISWRTVLLFVRNLTETCQPEKAFASFSSCQGHWATKPRGFQDVSGHLGTSQGVARAYFVMHFLLVSSTYGYGSKYNHQGTAGFTPCFPLPGVSFWVHIFDPQPYLDNMIIYIASSFAATQTVQAVHLQLTTSALEKTPAIVCFCLLEPQALCSPMSCAQGRPVLHWIFG